MFYPELWPGKVIDLVNYRREKELYAVTATGTDGMIEEGQRKRYTKKQREVQRYAETLHVTLSNSLGCRSLQSGNKSGIFKLEITKCRLYD